MYQKTSLEDIKGVDVLLIMFLKMLKLPEFLKYPEWYIEDKKFENEIGHNEKRYKIKENAPYFIKKVMKNIRKS